MNLPDEKGWTQVRRELLHPGFYPIVTSRDGGTAKKLGRVIQCSALKRQSKSIIALCKEGRSVRRFEPRREDNMWVVDLVPCFRQIFTGGTDIRPGSTGIYRYLNEGEIIYIGRGVLRERFSSHDRKEWRFDTIEYTILNDDALERHWETFWLDNYRRNKGVWPFHNQIGGVVIRDSRNG